MNNITVAGIVGKIPEVKTSESGKAWAALSIADKRYDSRQKQNTTQWWRVLVFGHYAEFAEKQLDKGVAVIIAGEVQTSKWTDRDGAEKTTMQIIATKIDFAPKGNSNSNG